MSPRRFQDISHYTAGFRPPTQPGQPDTFTVVRRMLPGPVGTGPARLAPWALTRVCACALEFLGGGGGGRLHTRNVRLVTGCRRARAAPLPPHTGAPCSPRTPRHPPSSRPPPSSSPSPRWPAKTCPAASASPSITHPPTHHHRPPPNHILASPNLLLNSSLSSCRPAKSSLAASASLARPPHRP